MHTRAIALSIALSLAGCASVEVPSAPRQGPIAAGTGGAVGYQHGEAGSLLILGGDVKRIAEYGYLKQSGDEGTLAIRLSNGSAFGVPDARARSLKGRPYGASPKDHDTFVKNYFVRLGVPAEQVASVRTMTMLEASGRSDEAKRPVPRILAYYSVLERAVDGILVPDSIAWARVNADGRIVAEAVYWPTLSGDVVAGAKKLRETLADPQRRSLLESRVPGAIGGGHVAIRHASAWVDSPFEAFASFDVAVLAAPTPVEAASGRAGAEPVTGRTSPAGAIIVRHLDADGVERLLPQESRNIGNGTAVRRQKTRP